MNKYRLKKDIHLYCNVGGGNIFRRGEIVEIIDDDGGFKLSPFYLGKGNFEKAIKLDFGFFPIPIKINFDKYFYKLSKEDHEN
jgi:hypothetical protein